MLINQFLFMHHQKHFVLQQMRMKKTPTARHYSKTKTLEYTALNEISLSNPFSQKTGISREIRIQESKGIEDTRRTKLSKSIEQTSYNLRRLKQLAQNIERYSPGSQYLC